MKYTWFAILLSASILFGCSTLEVAERPDGDSSLVMMYFKPPEGMRLTGVGIAAFVEKGVGSFFQAHRTDKGLVYIENIPPGRYYIREVDMLPSDSDGILTFYFGSAFSMNGFEEYSFTVEKNEVLFVGAYQFEGSFLGIYTWGGLKISAYHGMTKKDCIVEILKNIRTPSWRSRLEEELANPDGNAPSQ
jgi:hypothetical protein